MRSPLFAVATALLAISACAREDAVATDAASPEEAQAGGPPTGAAPTVEDLRAESLAQIDREACAAGGGEVRQAGRLGTWRCVTPYADAGKVCRDGDDCLGRCLADGDGAAAGASEIAGACEADDNPFGCFTEIEDGAVAGAVCVD